MHTLKDAIAFGVELRASAKEVLDDAELFASVGGGVKVAELHVHTAATAAADGAGTAGAVGYGIAATATY